MRNSWTAIIRRMYAWWLTVSLLVRRPAAASAGSSGNAQGSGAVAGAVSKASGRSAAAPVKRSYKNGVAHVVQLPACTPVCATGLHMLVTKPTA